MVAAYVLVHGAFHGGWCWRRVAALLRGAGGEVFTPTLTGLGEREHLARPDTGLETHILDVLNVLRCEDLREVVLVGHSYSGMVIAGAADRAPERIKCVVYLDAYIPEDGQSLADIKGDQWRESLLERARDQGDGWRLPAPPAAAFDIHDEGDARWADALLSPHPVKTFTDPVRLSDPASQNLPHVYIACTRQEDNFEWYRDLLRGRKWRWIEIDTGHDAMITAPRQLTDILLDLK